MRTFVTAAFLALLIRASHAQLLISRACGLQIAPCPDGMRCIPNDKSCTNTDYCAGHCEVNYSKPNKEWYRSCGGFRPEPRYCDRRSECIDDPRDFFNCGLACDKPGICVPWDRPECGGEDDDECPDGLVCYEWPESELYQGRGDNSAGVCL
jgi:hypothetical protein